MSRSYNGGETAENAHMLAAGHPVSPKRPHETTKYPATGITPTNPLCGHVQGQR